MKRREQRECIFQLLFRVEFNQQEEMPEQADLYLDDIRKEQTVQEKDEAYILEKYSRIVEELPKIDAMLDEASKGWKISRMGKVELTVLRLAVYEMKFDEDIPEKVAINEAVELARKFGGDDAPAFINGVLAKLAVKQER
ncbi:MAG: transcription antitermination factor NusB [Lachnospiraceae bacterium]|nr:transcription antitermination factor NusB [Lachnospiraceae bacterium]